MKDRSYNSILTLAALGVVFGDIGTSPLYSLRECFNGPHAVPVSPENVIGVVSLIIWTLIIVVSCKYLVYVMTADNKGEGGVLALMALAQPRLQNPSTKAKLRILLGIAGASLLYGDGIITPAISVLSAVEGLNIATPMFESHIVNISTAILILLFLIQRRGTAKIGMVFGPIILLWFVTIGGLGLRAVLSHPAVLSGINPFHALNFFVRLKLHGYFVIGAVFLCVTGVEALYADMGHFGKSPIRIGWFYIVFPGLLLNYLGQGAILLTNPQAADHPFYRLAPPSLLYPLVALATTATIIASQALISGAFSLTRQAVLLGFLPRMYITHTSSKQIGQIFIPLVNVFLFVGTVFLIFQFKSSGNLAAAYGIAVSTTMVITTLLTYYVTVRRWRWQKKTAFMVTGFFLAVDFAFFGANLVKVAEGGWVPLVIGGAIMTIMLTWNKGRQILAGRVKQLTPPLDQFLAQIKSEGKTRVPGTAIFMTRNYGPTPPALYHNVKHNNILHQTVILLQVVIEEQPTLPEDERIVVEDLTDSFFRVTFRYGFTESPDIPELLQKCEEHGLKVTIDESTFFFGRESLVINNRSGMASWREKLFLILTTNAQRATVFYKIPPERVVEIGFQVVL